MMENGLKIRSMDKEQIFGQTALNIKANFKTTKSMVKDSTIGSMAEFMRVTGITDKSMERVSIHGLMEDTIRENFLTTRNMDNDFTNGQMGKNTKEVGKMVNNTDKGNILALRIYKK